jgi:hypothetical protein
MDIKQLRKVQTGLSKKASHSGCAASGSPRRLTFAKAATACNSRPEPKVDLARKSGPGAQGAALRLLTKPDSRTNQYPLSGGEAVILDIRSAIAQ